MHPVSPYQPDGNQEEEHGQHEGREAKALLHEEIGSECPELGTGVRKLNLVIHQLALTHFLNQSLIALARKQIRYERKHQKRCHGKQQ